MIKHMKASSQHQIPKNKRQNSMHTPEPIYLEYIKNPHQEQNQQQKNLKPYVQ